MCLFSFFLSLEWHQSSCPRAPWKNKLKAYGSGACMVKNKEMSTWFMFYMISSTIAGRTKGKNESYTSIILYVRLISRRSLRKWKKCVIFFEILKAFITLFVTVCLLLFHPHCFWSSLEGQRPSLYLSVPFFLSLFLSLSFSLFKIWSLAFVSVPTHQSLNNQDMPSFFLQMCLQEGGWRKSYLGVLKPLLGLEPLLNIVIYIIQYI